jgi:hypothetical protein
MQRGDVLVPFAVIRQEPVGHGGFHTGAFCFPDLHHPYLHWVYDCGSWHKARAALQKRIKELVKRVRCTKRSLDLLFVSHFDVDHVNGLHTLLDQLPVDTVVIPYLEPADAFVTVTAAVERQDATPANDPDWRKWLLELHQIVFDPQSWFGNRGVRRVIRIRPGSAPELGLAIGEGPLPLPELSGTAEGEALEGWPFYPVFIRPDGSLLPPRSATKADKCEVMTVDAGTLVGLATQSGVWTDWWFVPYVHPISERVRRDLHATIKRTLAVSRRERLSDRLAHSLKHKAKRRELAELYRREELDDANGISMSLYEGPRYYSSRRTVFGRGRPPSRNVGWLLTADAKLQNRARRQEWMQFFRTRVSQAPGALMLPHHGADRNFHESILDFAPDAKLFFTADHADEKRPQPNVKATLDACNPARPAIRVSERPRDVLEAISGPPEFFYPSVSSADDLNSSSRSIRGRFKICLDSIPAPAEPVARASDLPVEDDDFLA